MVWIDMKQSDGNIKEAAVSQEQADAPLQTKGEGYENWWPGMRRWHLGMVCEDATLELGEPEVLDG